MIQFFKKFIYGPRVKNGCLVLDIGCWYLDDQKRFGNPRIISYDRVEYKDENGDYILSSLTYDVVLCTYSLKGAPSGILGTGAYTWIKEAVEAKNMLTKITRASTIENLNKQLIITGI